MQRFWSFLSELVSAKTLVWGVILDLAIIAGLLGWRVWRCIRARARARR